MQPLPLHAAIPFATTSSLVLSCAVLSFPASVAMLCAAPPCCIVSYCIVPCAVSVDRVKFYCAWSVTVSQCVVCGDCWRQPYPRIQGGYSVTALPFESCRLKRESERTDAVCVVVEWTDGRMNACGWLCVSMCVCVCVCVCCVCKSVEVGGLADGARFGRRVCECMIE